MNTDKTNKTQTPADKPHVPEVVSTRVGDLEPLVAKWLDAHPRVAISHLVKDGLRMALKPYAGKRYAHLVDQH